MLRQSTTLECRPIEATIHEDSIAEVTTTEDHAKEDGITQHPSKSTARKRRRLETPIWHTQSGIPRTHPRRH